MISLEVYKDQFDAIKNLAVPDRIINPENEPVFNVDLNTRKIKVPSEFRTLAVQGDHMAETIWFAFDRYFDGEDLKEKAIAIQYQNAAGVEGMLPANYHECVGEGNRTLLVGWSIPYEVTCAPGTITLSLRFYTTVGEEEKKVIDYNLNTESIKLTIAKGLFIEAATENENIYPEASVLEELVQRLDDLLTDKELTFDYSKATNRPLINNIELVGNKEFKINEVPLVLNTEFKYEDLINKPKINKVSLEENTVFSYKDLVNFPKINNVELNDDIVLSYNGLSDKPMINGILLTGDKKDSDLNISYENLTNKPKINGTELSKEFTLLYSSLTDKPAINNIELTKDTKFKINEVSLEENTAFSYKDLINKPQIKVDGIDYTIGDDVIEVTKITVDTELSREETAINPVQNKVITAAIDAIWEELDGMTFIPLSISSFECAPNLVEIGSTVNEVHFDWKISGIPLHIYINEMEIEDINATEIDLTELNLTENKEFTLSAQDKKGNNDSSIVELIFTNKVFYGVSEQVDSFDSTFLNDLNGKLQTTKEGNINVVAEENQYIYYAVPTSYGACAFTIGGFTGGFKRVATISYTNEFEVATNYDIWKSDNANLGATNIIIS